VSFESEAFNIFDPYYTSEEELDSMTGGNESLVEGKKRQLEWYEDGASEQSSEIDDIISEEEQMEEFDNYYDGETDNAGEEEPYKIQEEKKVAWKVEDL